MFPVTNAGTEITFKTQAACGLDKRISNILSAMQRGLPHVDDSYERHSDVMRLTCFGPSLDETWQKLRERGGDIWTVSGANAFLWKKGVSALYHMEAEPRAHKAKLLEGSSPHTTYFIASRCAPEIFDALTGKKVALYHINVPDERPTLEKFNGLSLVPPAWSVGLMAIMLGLIIGYKKFEIFGMDGSFRMDGTQHASDHPRWEEGPVTVTVDGRRFLSHHAHVIAAGELGKFVKAVGADAFTFIGNGMIPYIYEREYIFSTTGRIGL